MIIEIPNINPLGRYELRDAAKALQVNKSTINRWTNAGLLCCQLRKANGRRVWAGSELIRFWKANY